MAKTYLIIIDLFCGARDRAWVVLGVLEVKKEWERGDDKRVEFRMRRDGEAS